MQGYQSLLWEMRLCLLTASHWAGDYRCRYLQKGVFMSKRQDNLTFRVLEDMTLRAFNAGSAKSNTISEWCCSHIGNPCKTLTTSVPKIVVYDF